MTTHRFLFPSKALHWLVKEITTQKKQKITQWMKRKENHCGQIRVIAHYRWRESLCSSGGRKLSEIVPQTKRKMKKKMTEEEEKEKKAAMNEKENEISLHPTVLEWRIFPAGCQETASSFDFRRFSGAEFSQRIAVLTCVFYPLVARVSKNQPECACGDRDSLLVDW